MLTPTQKLVDEIRDLQAQAAGKEAELCMLLGDREGAERAKREMYALIEARQAAAYAQAEIAGGCYFHDEAALGMLDMPALAKRQGA